MKHATCIALLCFGIHSFAQLTPEQRIQDSVIGWWSNNYWDRNWKSPTDTEGKIIEKHLNNLVDWMKKSYTPVGGLGTVTRFRDSWGYGVKFNVWNVSYALNGKWIDEKGHFKPVSEENTPFYIHVNQIVGAYPMKFLNKKGAYYFTWMADGTGDLYVHQKTDPRPKGIHPNASRFITVRNNNQSVMLAPNNQLPFVEVTKGELLEMSDKALAEMMVSGNQSKKQDYERYRTTIAELRIKYKNSLNTPAVVRNIQSDEYMFNFSDPFELNNGGNPLHNYKVYKFAPGVYDKLKLAQPQWVTVYYPFFGQTSGSQLNELYTALTQNLNYQYIHDYFFSPEKVKGVAYTPSDEAGLKARLDGFRNKGKQSLAANSPKSPSSKNATRPNVYFADDFSANAIGSPPKNWYFNQMKEHCKIVDLPKEEGNWVLLGRYNQFRPNLMNYPLPKNFSIEFDLITNEDFDTRTGGSVELMLNTRKMHDTGAENTNGNGETVKITFNPGVASAKGTTNFRGQVKMEIKGTPSQNKQNGVPGISGTEPLPEFTNADPKVHVKVKVMDGKMEVFVNDKLKLSSTQLKMAYGEACVVCGIGPSTVFNSINWQNVSESDTAKNKIHLGNVVMTKL
ncbi:hypothetical protein [Flagellimonas amoyensis]|uniref:hypothetical protein n=1 Tax=Flagellimonas amoyensis TaxID=2169401 RepID=UPI000D3AF3B2|nr:hypothetical protein [Allomuricauda amoyensis]